MFRDCLETVTLTTVTDITSTEVIKVLKRFDHDREYSVWIGGSALSSCSSCSSCGHSSIMECAADIRKCLYAMVVLSDSVAMLQEIGEQMPNECDVGHAEDFFLVTVSVEASLGAKLAQAEREC